MLFPTSQAGGLTISGSSNWATTIMHDPFVLRSLINDAVDPSVYKAASSGWNSAKILIERWRSRLLVKNSTNVGAHVTEYRLVARRDIPRNIPNLAGVATPLDMNTFFITQAPLQQQYTALINTAAAAVAGVGPQDLSLVDTSPFSSAVLVQYFKVKKVKRMYMPPGTVWLRQYVYKKPRQFSNSHLSDFVYDAPDQKSNVTTAATMLKGTSTSLFSFYGDLVGQAATSNCSVAPITLQFLSELHVVYRNIATQRSRYARFDALPTTLSAPLVIDAANPIAPVSVANE